MRKPPTVADRQRVERLVAAVISGLDPRQAVGSPVTDRLAIVTAVMVSEASEKVAAYDEASVAYRRYLALCQLFEAMADQASAHQRQAAG